MALMRVRDKNGNIQPILAIKGEKGDSAYKVAQANGFEGTTTEWLESLHGDDYILTEEDKAEIAEIVIDSDRQIIMLKEADMLPAIHDTNGAILTDQNGNIVLRY